jgi:NAD(P)-dependent dehydrogenase (short-subunit alcohol dehydrogenase family)
MSESRTYDFSGRVALVTGAGKESGIGFAIAKRLAADGATVIISDVCADICEGDYARMPTPQELDTLAKSIGGRGLVMDICQEDSVDGAAKEIAEKFGRLDFLVNNAGAGPAPNLLQYMDLDMWRKTLDINLTGTLLVSRAMLPLMTGENAAIVNTASVAGKRPRSFGGAYCVTKAGVIMMTKVMALETGPAGIRVNAICPGYIITDMTEWKWGLKSKFLNMTVDEARAEEEAEVPLSRIGTPDEVADLAAFLLSERSRYITGQAWNIDGGIITEI